MGCDSASGASTFDEFDDTEVSSSAASFSCGSVLSGLLEKSACEVILVNGRGLFGMIEKNSFPRPQVEIEYPDGWTLVIYSL